MSQVIESDSRVLAHISLFLEDGSMADSTKSEGKPAWILMGEDEFSPAFEKQVMGLKEGENKRFVLDAPDAFGQSNPDNIHFVDISLFPSDIEIEPGVIISFEQPNGQAAPGLICDVQGDSVKVDFNHPLAGKRVVFDIEVMRVEDKKA